VVRVWQRSISFNSNMRISQKSDSHHRCKRVGLSCNPGSFGHDNVVIGSVVLLTTSVSSIGWNGDDDFRAERRR
jgi:hypothetical protein